MKAIFGVLIIFFQVAFLFSQEPSIKNKNTEDREDQLFESGQNSVEDSVLDEKKKIKKRNAQKQALILFRRGAEAYNDGRYNLADIYFNDFKVLYPNHPEIAEIIYYQAKILLVQQKYVQAADKLEEYYRLNRGEDGEKALFQAVNLHIKMGNEEKAQILYNNLREVNPDSRFLNILNQKLEIGKLITANKFQGEGALDKLTPEGNGSKGRKQEETVIILE
jgi:TolA-binding protein